MFKLANTKTSQPSTRKAKVEFEDLPEVGQELRVEELSLVTGGGGYLCTASAKGDCWKE
ncbi:hypothetical protein ACN28E_32355 [Archangium lansingense]|uniref:hypothetical protein n=1 Tax=Archangium lansingense TaxID=2995310 RepID=UPI003B78D0E5